MITFLIIIGACIICAIVCNCVINSRVNALQDQLRVQRNMLASLEVLAEDADILPAMRFNPDRNSYQIVRLNLKGQCVILAEFSIETYGHQDAYLLADELIETIEQFRYYNK